MALADPTVRSQELGEELRTLREAAGCTLTSAGQRIDASASKICRIENGHITATPEDVAALLVVYGVTGPHRRELLDLAREAEKRGWWQRFTSKNDLHRRTLLTLESRASSIVSFEDTVIPGMLQTSEYTRAILEGVSSLAGAAIDTRVNFRQERQSVLTRRNAPHLLAIIDELALHRPLGGPKAFRRQLLHLLHEAERPNITLLVVPNDGCCHAGVVGGFLLIRRPDAAAVAFTENLTSCLYFEDRAEVEQYASVVQRLSEQAWDEEQSVALIENLTHTNQEATSTWTGSGDAAATAEWSYAWRSPETPEPRRSETPRTRTGPS